MLNISKTIEDGKALFVLEGRLDIETSPEFEEDLRGSLDNIGELVIDFEKLDYISSAGLRVLLATQKIMCKQGAMKLINVNSDVMEILDITGFSEILTIE
ncbi:MAG: STAS domain-containing protein [Firmicutes bacterium]|nr:STAS domain-containing protein [Bacillota bacterium]